jgi:hypothetical protein
MHNGDGEDEKVRKRRMVDRKKEEREKGMPE